MWASIEGPVPLKGMSGSDSPQCVRDPRAGPILPFHARDSPSEQPHALATAPAGQFSRATEGSADFFGFEPSFEMVSPALSLQGKEGTNHSNGHCPLQDNPGVWKPLMSWWPPKASPTDLFPPH